MGTGLRPAALAGAALLAACLAAAAPGRRAALEIENASRGRTFVVPLRPGEAFSVVSRHSMYDAPVTEEYALDRSGAVVLRAVSSPSPAVLEYFGITDPGERHPRERTMGEVVFRVAAGEPQRLRAGGAERSFLEFGDHGDRLVLRGRP